MRKSVAAHCPYCGNMINYFYLYDAKRSDFGYCSHCGGMYAVKYSPLAYMLVMGALGALVGGFAFWYLANKTLPGARYLLICTIVIVGMYFLMPLLITPRQVIVRGRLGGFPSPEEIPVHRKDRKRAARKLVEKHRPEVLHPQETDTEGINKIKNTKSNKKDRGARHMAPPEALRLRREMDGPAPVKTAQRENKNTKHKNKHEYTNSIFKTAGQRVRAWGSRIKSAAGTLADSIRNVAVRTGGKIRQWWKQCFRKRETPGKGQ